MTEDNLIYAKDRKCRDCEAQAVAFWPAIDPDIPSYPYCRKHLDKRQLELIIAFENITHKFGD